MTCRRWAPLQHTFSQKGRGQDPENPETTFHARIDAPHPAMLQTGPNVLRIQTWPTHSVEYPKNTTGDGPTPKVRARARSECSTSDLLSEEAGACACRPAS